jgi:predicted nucleic acid-binding protein
MLIAIHHPGHEYYQRAQEWFAKQRKVGWATCPITESGFIRITQQPAFPSHFITIRQAAETLQDTIAQNSVAYHFWPETTSVCQLLAEAPNRMGHRQITDYYLLKFCELYGGRLATLDSRITALVHPDLRDQLIEFID